MRELLGGALSDRSCWTCSLQKIGGTTFLGDCKWFEREYPPRAAKQITPAVVDKGCKFWTWNEKVQKELDLAT